MSESAIDGSGTLRTTKECDEYTDRRSSDRTLRKRWETRMTVTLKCVKYNEASRATTDLHVIKSPVDRNEIALKFHNQTSDLLKAKEWT